ncbi:alpha/beta hydrolase [Desulfotalea psychrophila]|uniref:Related to temperature sensitive supressor n=1 Tax=Desulfotalea psychrophila (strain LSv54 / DSM 12343) TaxID=177439 RepID=Q6AKX4_DESPS|nr:alpha/beta fold hydrolase [Desulfotalea psychrophila]CAG37001.1 related to temperature sensitive supressor [Desulfotalea psychrophila LSv54]
MTYSKLDQPEALSHIFHPVREARNTPPLNATDVDIEVEAGINISCRFYAAALDAPNIFFFHGNAESVSYYDEIAQVYTSHGLNLFMTSYRGYGWSDGEPTVTNMFADAVLLYDKASLWLKENGYTAPIIVMGRSLGSAPAIEVAKERDAVIKALIIESGFANTLPLAINLGIDVEASGLTEEDCFRNCQKIVDVKRPTMIFHGSRDTLIPAAEAENLQSFCGARGKQFHVIPGAEHNTMIEVGGKLYFETIRTFTDTLLGINNWRRLRKEFKKRAEVK